MYSCHGKVKNITQSSVSHDPSEIILICWFEAPETFLIRVFLNCFLWTISLLFTSDL